MAGPPRFGLIRNTCNKILRGEIRKEDYNVFISSNYKRSCLTVLPQPGKNIWKMNFFPGQGKVREFYGWPRKFRKDLESQGKIREFENNWQWQAVFRKFIYSVQEGKGYTFI